MKFLKLVVNLLIFTLLSVQVHAAEAWYEETMYSSGKIYVVVAVVLVVLVGIFAYLLWMDRRLKKLEDVNTRQEISENL